jgi:hypothetical protein
VDLLIELVAAYGFDPTWMLAFTLTQDFEGDHFTFFKVPAEDLEALYGLRIMELAVWDDLQSHVAEQLRQGRVVLVEADGYFLPDTRGVTYHEAHGKTTVGIFAMDASARCMEYFHNETRGALSGDDFDGVLQRLPTQAGLLMPYTEFVKADLPSADDPAALALKQLRHHYQRRPVSNPFDAYAKVLPDHLQALGARGGEYFHAYAFNTLRQFGANFSLLESLLSRWTEPDFVAAAAAARGIADEAKALQFKLARAVARQRFDGFVEGIQAVARQYDMLMTHVASGLKGVEDGGSVVGHP